VLPAGTDFLPLRIPSTFGMPYEYNKYGFQRRLAPQVLEIVRARDLQLVYERMSLSTYSGVIASRALEIPLVLEYNGSEAWTSKHWGSALRDHDLAVMAEDACLRHAHLCVTVSDVLRDELLARGVAEERIACYPNCVDPDLFDPERFGTSDRLALRESLGIAEDAVVVTFLGTFGQWHGVDVLARGMRRLVEEHHEWLDRRRVHFLLVGDGARAAEVDEILGGDARCADFCTRVGLVAQDDAPRYLAISDVAMSPHVPNPDGSRFFGSPTKLFEYMAMALPIVASRLDQIGEVLRPSLHASALPGAELDGATEALSLLAEPGDVEQLVTAIRFLVEQPSWRAALGRNARREALARYTWRHHVATILDRLDGLGLNPGDPS
jgi:glycosyltransferase involved in cell wall biosynthesis